MRHLTHKVDFCVVGGGLSFWPMELVFNLIGAFLVCAVVAVSVRTARRAQEG